jgi:hypothetical protein
MYGLVAIGLFVAALGLAAWRIWTRVRVPANALSRPVSGVSASAASVPATLISADRYRPMLRLLAEDDFNFVGANVALQRTLKAKRRELFRSYLRCLARDYSRLLAGIRSSMAMAGVDRPDLALALAKNRTIFAVAVYKVEVRLAFHALGVGQVDISGLVEAFEGLRAQVNVLSASAAAA